MCARGFWEGRGRRETGERDSSALVRCCSTAMQAFREDSSQVCIYTGSGSGYVASTCMYMHVIPRCLIRFYVHIFIVFPLEVCIAVCVKQQEGELASLSLSLFDSGFGEGREGGGKKEAREIICHGPRRWRGMRLYISLLPLVFVVSLGALVMVLLLRVSVCVYVCVF